MRNIPLFPSQIPIVIKDVDYDCLRVFEDQATPKSIVQLNDRPPAQWLGAYSSGRLIGCVGLAPTSKSKATVKGWWLVPEFDRSRFRKMLLARICVKAESMGLDQVELKTLHKLDALQEGFRPTTTVYGDGRAKFSRILSDPLLPNISLSIAVMSVPERAQQHTIPLLNQLGNDVPVKVFWDIEKEGCRVNARRCWESYKPRDTHFMIIADDMVVCRDFIPTVYYCLSLKPDVPISFFANRQIIEEARARKDSWAIISDGIWGNAMCLPGTMIPKYLAYEKDVRFPSLQWDDTPLLMYLTRHEIAPWATVPSLLYHNAIGESLAGHNIAVNQARWFIGSQVSGLSIDWTRGLLDPLISKANRGRNWERKYYFPGAGK